MARAPHDHPVRPIHFRPLAERRRRALLAALWLSSAAAAACAPRLAPMAGGPSPLPVPSPQLAPGYHQVVFQWEYQDPEMAARGEGVARLAAPDSARLDFFLAGGLGSGAAILIGDTLRLPGMEIMRRIIPPAPMLWAAVGRAAFPPARDTVVAVDDGLLRADIGKPVAYRAAFRGDTIVRLDRVDGGRVAEWFAREDDGTLRYRHETSRRSLVLRITRTFPLPELDASIWRFPP